jgi:hypothetical protein
VAELHGRKLAIDEGARPVVDDGGRLVYVDADAGTENPDELAPGQGVTIDPATVDPAAVDPENSTPQPTPDGT